MGSCSWFGPLTTLIGVGSLVRYWEVEGIRILMLCAPAEGLVSSWKCPMMVVSGFVVETPCRVVGGFPGCLDHCRALDVVKKQGSSAAWFVRVSCSFVFVCGVSGCVLR